jgi:hypothetical protein
MNRYQKFAKKNFGGSRERSHIVIIGNMKADFSSGAKLL